MDLQEQVETLTKLGLTVNQSKVFLALIQLEPSTVTQIAKSSNLAREVVYRTLPKLEKAGLVSKVISFPTEFKAISIDLATRILLEERTKETFEVKTKAIALVEQMKNRLGEKNQAEPQIISVSGKDYLSIFTRRQMLTTKFSADSIIVNSKFSFWWETSNPIFKRLLAKKVKIRAIIACSKERIHGRNIEQFEKNPNFKIKFIPDQIQVGVGIIDNKDILINTSPNNAFKPSFYWSNDLGVIALCRAYFEKYWDSPEIKDEGTVKH